jgi:hypothetical protein
MISQQKRARSYTSPLIQKHLQNIDPVKLEKTRKRMLKIMALSDSGNPCICNVDKNNYRYNEGDN